MNSHLWKTILDDLDEDIVNAAAERFGRAKFSGEEPGEYSPDSDPTEYSYSDGKKSRRRFIIGISSTAAAVAAGVFILRGVTMPQEVTQPLSGGETTEVSSVPDNPVDYIESQNDTDPELPAELETDGFSAALFEEYFYGLWGYPTADYNRPMELSYQDSMFGYSAGRTLAKMERTSDGCYMLAQTDSGYEVWFVPENDRESLFVYRGVQVVNGTVMRRDNGEFICDSFIEHSYDGIPAENESDRLGYFGIEKLAEEMGVSAEWLLNQEFPVEDRGAVLSRNNIGSRDMDYVILMEKTDSRVSLRMRYVIFYTDVNDNVSSYEMWLELHFEKNPDGSWSVSFDDSPGLYFGSDALYSGLTKEGLQLFKQSGLHGDWLCAWSGTGETLPTLNLRYDEDIFTPAEPCVGVAEAADGCALCRKTEDGYVIYYLDYNDPETLNVYKPNEYGFTSRESVIASYEKPLPKGYGGGVYVSWLGLERYKFMHDYNPDGDSLASVIERALTQDIEIGGSAANYTADMEGWDGYRIAEQSETLVLFSYQLFNAIGESCWVTQELVKQGANWTLGEITERELTNDDIMREEGFVPITWSDDLPLESEVEADGR